MAGMCLSKNLSQEASLASISILNALLPDIEYFAPQLLIQLYVNSILNNVLGSNNLKQLRSHK